MSIYKIVHVCKYYVIESPAPNMQIYFNQIGVSTKLECNFVRGKIQEPVAVSRKTRLTVNTKRFAFGAQ